MILPQRRGVGNADTARLALSMFQRMWTPATFTIPER